MPTKKYTLGSKNSDVLADLTLPSGETCQARRPGVAGLIAAGILDSLDSLTSLVQTEHIQTKSSRPTAKSTPEEQALAAGMAMMGDPSKMLAGFQMIDRLVAYVVTQPGVWVDYQLTGESEEEWLLRKNNSERIGCIGTSVLDLDDKLFIMTWSVGDSSDLTTFRQGLTGNVVDVASKQGVSRTTKRASSRK